MPRHIVNYTRPWTIPCVQREVTRAVLSGAHSVATVLTTESKTLYVEKKPREDNPRGQESLAHEASVLAALNRTSAQSPLKIPELLGVTATGITTSAIEGTNFKRREVAQLSASEKHTLGSILGRFVAHVADHVPIALSEQASRPPDYLQADLEAMADTTWPQRESHRSLFTVRQTLHEQSTRIKGKTVIMGHDDLSPSNYNFAQKLGNWIPCGVYDFANTQPTTPERELRFVGLLGQEAIDGAIEGYETASGGEISKTGLAFWTTVVAASMSSYRIATGRAVDSQLQAVLAQNVPSLNWKELGTPEW